MLISGSLLINIKDKKAVKAIASINMYIIATLSANWYTQKATKSRNAPLNIVVMRNSLKSLLINVLSSFLTSLTDMKKGT